MAAIKLLKFGSKDCSPCVSMAKARTLERLAEKHDDLEVVIDDDLSMGDPETEAEKAAEARAEQYKIRSMPTLIFLDPTDDSILLKHSEGAVNLKQAEELLAKARKKLAKKAGG